MKHDTAGDPMSGLKWTRRTTTKIASELRELGIEVSDRTVAALLKKMGFSLRVNHKKIAGASHPYRDAQFNRITELRERGAADNTPVISVDTKKKELVGAFKNPGAKWDREPVRVNDIMTARETANHLIEGFDGRARAFIQAGFARMFAHDLGFVGIQPTPEGDDFGIGHLRRLPVQLRRADCRRTRR